MAYDSPKQVHELDIVSATITNTSLIPCQALSGERLGAVTAPDIVKVTTVDDIQDGTTYKKLTASEKSSLTDHIISTANPHSVTKSQVGLGNADNTSDLNKPISTATQTALNGKANTVHVHTEFTSYDSHLANVANPHSVTPDQIGLGEVDNTSDVNKPISTATQTELDTKQETLVSGVNIKTINSNSLLGSGNIVLDLTSVLNDTAYDSSWNGDITHAPTRNAVYDKFVTVDSSLSTKAPIASPAFTGTPTAPTAAEGTTTTQIATTAFVMGNAGGLRWSVETANITAVKGHGYMMDCSDGSKTVTCIASPTEGDTIAIADYDGSLVAGLTTITIARNGSNIMGIAEDLILDVKNQRVVLSYSDATQGWIITDMEPASNAYEFLPYAVMHVQCQKPSGTSLGVSITGTQTREITTVVYNDIEGAYLSGNVITLPPGEYSFDCSVDMGSNSAGILFLYDVGAGQKALSSRNSSGEAPRLVGRLSLAESKSFELRHYTSNTESLGVAVSQGTEIYLDGIITKIGGNYAPKPVLSTARLQPMAGLNGPYQVTGFDITVTGTNQITVGKGMCLDTTLANPIAVSSNTAIIMDTTANKLFHLFAVHVIATDSDTVKAYDSFAAPASDSTIDRFCPIDFWQNNGSGEAKAGYSKNGWHWWEKGSENPITSSAIPAAGCGTSLDLTGHLPDLSLVDSVGIGAVSASTAQNVVFGITSGVAMGYCLAVNSAYVSDASGAWGTNNSFEEIPVPSNGTIYYGSGSFGATYAATLRLHCVKLRR